MLRRRIDVNKDSGKQFEFLFYKQAQRSGFLAQKNDLSCRIIGKGKLIPIKSELDFKLISQDGRVGFFDCKSFAGDHFYTSDIDKKQIERATLYKEWGVPSGFVVWFRDLNKVCFITGGKIRYIGGKITPEDMLCLGRFEHFDLSLIMTK